MCNAMNTVILSYAVHSKVNDYFTFSPVWLGLAQVGLQMTFVVPSTGLTTTDIPCMIMHTYMRRLRHFVMTLTCACWIEWITIHFRKISLHFDHFFNWLLLNIQFIFTIWFWRTCTLNFYDHYYQNIILLT